MDYSSRNRRSVQVRHVEKSPEEHLSFFKKIKRHVEERWFEWISVVGIGVILIFFAFRTDEKIGDLVAIAKNLENFYTTPSPPPYPFQSSGPGSIMQSSANPIHITITRDTPIYVESDYSDLDSNIAVGYLQKILPAHGFIVTKNESDAKFVLRIQDVTDKECSINLSEIETNPADNQLPSTCGATINVIAQYAQGNNALFSGSFSGKAPENGDSDGPDSDQDALYNAAFNIYAYISAQNKN